jgi:hypothetical protein
MSDFFKEQYLQSFNNFIKQLRIFFPTDDILKVIDMNESLSDDNKISKGMVFGSLLNNENLDMFIKCKIKVFSHKDESTKLISESLFGHDLSLKNILNNQSDEIKQIIWSYLHNICLCAELLKPDNSQNKKLVEPLIKIIYPNLESSLTYPLPNKENKKNKKNSTSSKLHKMLDVDINDETTDMINDIVSSFETVLSQKAGANPLSGILEISQKISVKYADKINSGEIELDKLMQAISKKVPGMEGMMGDILKGSGSGNKKVKETIIIDENFSTANVNLGMNKEDESKSNMNIAGMMKMADQFGVLPGGKSSGGGLPNMGKMMEMMKRLETVTNDADADALKAEMDTFLQNEAGINMNDLNKQMEEVTKQLQDDEE